MHQELGRSGRLGKPLPRGLFVGYPLKRLMRRRSRRLRLMLRQIHQDQPATTTARTTSQKISKTFMASLLPVSP